MADKRYNGWTNYETWNIALWIDNEEGSHLERCEKAQAAWDGAEGESDREASAACTLASELREWIEEANPLAEQASMFSDLLSAALSEVNWYEIAENWLEDVNKAVNPMA